MSENRYLSIDVIGDAFVDLLCYLENDVPEAGGDARLYKPVNQMAGGSAVNTATHVQSLFSHKGEEWLSIALKLFTTLNPNDDYGRLLLRHAEEHRFQLINCHQENSASSTGHCIVMVAQGERSFLTHTGCMDEFEASDVQGHRLIGGDCNVRYSHIHIAGFFNIRGFWDGKLKRELEAYRTRSSSLTISLVPQHDASGNWDGGLLDLLPLVDFLVLNELEAEGMTAGRDNGVADHHMEGANELEQWAAVIALASPSTCVVVTRGDRGAVALRGGKIMASQLAATVQAVDPTGAGDSFCAGFLYGIWRWQYAAEFDPSTDLWPRKAIEQGLVWGCATGARGVMTYGASIPSPFNKIEEFVNQIS